MRWILCVTATDSYSRLPVRRNSPSLLPGSVVKVLLEVDLAVDGGHNGDEGSNVVDHLDNGMCCKNNEQSCYLSAMPMLFEKISKCPKKYTVNAYIA